MSQFENVTVVKAANIYFDGGVTSREVRFADGSRKTLGFMQPGDYEFSTAQPELMEVLGGSADVLLPGSDEWQSFGEGDSFDVPGDASFKLKITGYFDYCCTYL